MKYNKQLIIAMGVCCALIVLSILLFFIKFSTSPLSNDISQWAQFGDFMGGVLNPLLSIINICIFIYLTVTIQSIANSNHERSLDMDKKIALMTMKREELNHFKNEMDSTISKWEAKNYDLENAKQILYRYNTLEYRMSYLFPSMNSLNENKMFRRYLIEIIDYLERKESGNKNALLNTYGMLISSLGKMVIE
ncbi:hypothetical protein [Sphingobacterium detergens]|uniref:Phage abortive infection protein n=1 Tax=Sphingobacterium detergens TaxID=1145106 RepID=A0A420ARL6_SPHD1|nr:hypothetical protein [Sphingobacterium detergens]RKE47112.1 hypothetical protein DFQ12_4273 [Sphingobacterium detergens]